MAQVNIEAGWYIIWDGFKQWIGIDRASSGKKSWKKFLTFKECVKKYSTLPDENKWNALS